MVSAEEFCFKCIKYTAKLKCVCCFSKVSGHQGAGKISQVLAARTNDLHFVLDEGMTVLQGVLDWIEPAVAL